MKTMFAAATSLAFVATTQPPPVAHTLSAWMERLGWTLVHSVWQLTLLGVFAALVLRLLDRRSSQTRYVAGVALMIGMLAAPCATWMWIDARPQAVPGTIAELAFGREPTAVSDVPRDAAPPDIIQAATPGSVDSRIVERPGEPPVSEAPILERPILSQRNPSAEHGETPLAKTGPAVSQSFSLRDWIEPRLFLIVGCWFVGMVLCALRPVWGLWTQWRLRRVGLSPVSEAIEYKLADLARRLGIRHIVRIAESTFVQAPMVVGYLRPWILLPASVVVGLTPSQLEAVLAHELAHIRRHDWVVNALQVVVETLLFHHPAVWWLSHRIRQERENCCDDLAVSLLGDAAGYSRMLLSLTELRHDIPRPALAANGGVLLTRVRRLLEPHHRSGRASRGLLLGLILLGLAGVGVYWVFSSTKVEKPIADLPADEDTEEWDAVMKRNLVRGNAIRKERNGVVQRNPDWVAPVREAIPALSKEMVIEIARMRENEALFRNMALSVSVSCILSVPEQVFTVRQVGDKQVRERRTAFRLVPAERTWRGVTKGDQLSFSEVEFLKEAGRERPSLKRIVICDGTQTVAIDEGTSATLYRGRYVPPQMAAPHCWCLFEQDMSMPLSAYLEWPGPTDDDPQVAGQRRVYPLQPEYGGEELLDELNCVKVNLKVHPGSPPRTLWLAKDRNYHVARYETAQIRSRVTKWRELAEGIWIPERVVAESLQLPAEFKQEVILESAILNPTIADRFFALPEIPASLPKFVVEKEGRLEDGPMHPVPASAAAGTTLKTILSRLAVEEAQYDRFDVATVEHDFDARRYITGTRERSVAFGNRWFHLHERESGPANGHKKFSFRQEAFDGRLTRAEWCFSPDGEEWSASGASLSLQAASKPELFRPHTTVFAERHPSLFDELDPLAPDVAHRLVVEYVGDERIGEIHCHKLKCAAARGTLPSSEEWFYVWLARDRNLIAVRHETYSPKWMEHFPKSIAYVDDLREVRPGLWFPHGSIRFDLDEIRPEGLIANRPQLRSRRDLLVESLTLDPQVDEALFTNIEVPEGTQISVFDAGIRSIGTFILPQAGNIDVPADELDALREKHKTQQEETERRKQPLPTP